MVHFQKVGKRKRKKKKVSNQNKAMGENNSN